MGFRVRRSAELEHERDGMEAVHLGLSEAF